MPLTGVAKRGNPTAHMHRNSVLPAIAEAAYLGYVETKNPNTHVKTYTDYPNISLRSDIDRRGDSRRDRR